MVKRNNQFQHKQEQAMTHSPIYIPPPLHKRAKASAAHRGETLREFATGAIERELAHREHAEAKRAIRKARLNKAAEGRA
jgi:hypothetical protein